MREFWERPERGIKGFQESLEVVMREFWKGLRRSFARVHESDLRQRIHDC